ncbi:VOC family protein [Corynebacterium felinum]|uniref:Bleomycin resistance protein n=1 Tax=Corynebacterium felinum TaxID=131318 RepID=A0ABU2BEX8_9CORY|nr:VOC family protein [Corynebacterium felinum]MDF5821190.1 VOC family protein [Corynebacterium felinum]MDR7356293.1 catechol 2,3-dioxygenase-like lactoylglutathione lyase family enzyme [Corynebacterium felinum]WJY95626.1 Glyoxalase-like domain protein [Corynebacterium felinum]
MEYNDLIPELIVTDIEKSRWFYCDLLGFTVEYERPQEKFLFISLRGIQLMLEQGSHHELSTLSYPFGRGMNLTFGVPNIKDVYAQLIAANYPIHRPLERREFQVDQHVVTPQEFAILDPDGYYIRISD